MITFNQSKKRTLEAMQAFQQKLLSGEVVLPNTLPDAEPSTLAVYPQFIIFNKKIVPTKLDPETNTLSLDDVDVTP